MMPTYKGNRGNLLQHWVLVEALAQLRRVDLAALPLCLVDGYSMSPYARRSEAPGQTAAEFDTVASQLPGQRSPFERAWQSIVQNNEDIYPSSAAFVRHIWDGPLQMVLCEADDTTAADIEKWRATVVATTSVEIHRGDWRQRFGRSFPESVSAYMFSFDPNMFDRNGPPSTPNASNMYPRDILRVGATLLDLSNVPVLVQLSTYSANNANRQADVCATVEPILRAAGMRLRSMVAADGNMMSLVFSRNLDSVNLEDLSDRFADWRQRATATPA